MYKQWIYNVNEELKAELLLIADNAKEIDDRFYKNLEFGTGGLRGLIGAGTNRMNVYTVAKVSKGIAEYIKSISDDGSVVIAYDSRNKSVEFATTAAKVFSACGIETYKFNKLMPTPVLSFAVRQLKTTIGIVITASHNPAQYNGYKVYGSDGCQITDNVAKIITGYINEVDDVFGISQTDSYSFVDDSVYENYIKSILRYSEFKECKKFAPKIVYSPLNGSGNLPVRDVLHRIGFEDVSVVPEQEKPDGNFSTCPYPNPEEEDALKLAVKLAKKEGAQLVLATDPDADRVGVAERQKSGEFRMFSGNEIGILLFEYILKQKKLSGNIPENALVIKTIVTSDMCYPIAKEYGVNVKEVLTGFKYIGEQISLLADSNDFLFGYEESYGYLVGDHCRDKDAVSASMLICEMAAYYNKQEKTLTEVLESLYDKYGYYYCNLKSIEFIGKSGLKQMNTIIEKLRKQPWKEIAGKKIEEIFDYSNGLQNLPKSNILSFAGRGFKVILRPSGTEPKLKIYFMTIGISFENAKFICRELEKDINMKLDN